MENPPLFLNTPSFFKLQWHITDKCNFRCKHCYQEGYAAEMPLAQLRSVLNQYVATVKQWNIPREKSLLAITGGEPLIHPDFLRFSAEIWKHSDNFLWSTMSNGTLLNRWNVKFFKFFNISAFQVSLEGLEKNNDRIRGAGSFKKIISAIKLLVKNKISPTVSFTVTKENYSDVFPLGRILSDIGVETLYIRRFVPYGTGLSLGGDIFTPIELTEFYWKVQDFAAELNRKGSRMLVPLGCEANFLYKCAGPGALPSGGCAITTGNIMTLLPNGDIYPCRRLPLVVGNIFKNSFEEIYFSTGMKDIRDIRCLSETCQKCSRLDRCYGGARCITYALNSRFDLPDPQCPYAV